MMSSLDGLIEKCHQGGIKTTPFAVSQMMVACKQLGPELVMAIIDNSVANGAQKWAYIQTALDKAIEQGINGVEDYQHRHWMIKNNIVDRTEPSQNHYLQRDDLSVLLQGE